MNLLRFTVGQKVVHARYGKCTVDEIQPKSMDESFQGGWTLVINNQKGIDQFTRDRGGHLPRCFEGDAAKLSPKLST